MDGVDVYPSDKNEHNSSHKTVLEDWTNGGRTVYIIKGKYYMIRGWLDKQVR